MDGALPMVVRTLPHGPAEQAHLVAGDHILAIEDRSTEGQGLGALVMQLRGKPGSQAMLTVQRGEQVLSVMVRREAMHKEANDYGPRSDGR